MKREPMLVHCGKCHHEWAPALLPMEAGLLGRVLKAARCPSCGAGGKALLLGPFPKPTGDGDWRAWMQNGDTGTSSKTIWSVMTGETVERHGIPYDPADFGRCYRLLKVMPSWRARMPEVATAHPAWAGLVAAWDELTTLYEEESPSGTAPKLYARMQALRQR